MKPNDTVSRTQKRVFYTELAYLFGLILLAVGTAMMERADYGVSMVVAPAYLLHLKISEFLPFFSFGMAEYTLQAALLLLLMLVLRRAKLSYLFSFVTAVLYGFCLDGAIALCSFVPSEALWVRGGLYLVGMLLCSFGVSLLFRTYISPEVYELFVKEVSAKYGFEVHKCKTVYDCASCLLSILLSFLFFGFGHFEGIRLGTVICALLNGTLIRLAGKVWERFWRFEDRLRFRRFF